MTSSSEVQLPFFAPPCLSHFFFPHPSGCPSSALQRLKLRHSRLTAGQSSMLHKVLAVHASGTGGWKDATFWMILYPLPRKKLGGFFWRSWGICFNLKSFGDLGMFPRWWMIFHIILIFHLWFSSFKGASAMSVGCSERPGAGRRACGTRGCRTRLWWALTKGIGPIPQLLGKIHLLERNGRLHRSFTMFYPAFCRSFSRKKQPHL